jgi:Flp pilus assembly protein TadD
MLYWSKGGWIESSSKMKLSPRLIALALSLVCVGLQPAWAADAVVRSIVFNPSSHNIKIDASSPVHAAMNTIDIGGRQRVIVDLDNAELGISLPQDAQLLRELGTHVPGLRNLSTHQFGSATHPMVRLVMDLDASAQRSYLKSTDGSEIELVLGNRSSATSQSHPAYGVSSNYCATHRCSPASMPNWTGGMTFNNANVQAQTTPIHPVVANTVSGTTVTKPQSEKSDINLDDLKRALIKANQRYEEQVSKNQELNRQIESLKTDQAAYQKKLNTATQSKDAQEQLKSDNEQLKSKIADQNSELEKTRQQLSTLQQSHTSREERKAASSSSQKELKASKEKLDAAEAQLKESEQKLVSLQAENEKLNQKITEISKTSSTAPASSNPEINSMRKQLIVAQTSLNEAIKTINEQNKEVANLRGQISDIKNAGEPGATGATDEATQKQLQEKDATIGGLKKEVQMMKNAMASVAKPTGAKQPASVTELKAQAQQIKTQTQQLATQSQQLKTQSQQIASLQTELKTSKTLAAQKQKDVETARQEIERLTTLRPSTANGSESDGVALDLKAGTNLANAERHYQTAKTALDNKQMDQAISEFRQAVNGAPDVGRYAIDASAAFTENQQIAEGIEILTHYLTRNPSDRDAYTQLGKLYLLNDQPEAAAQAFHRAIPISTLNNYASALKKTNKLSDAESVFKLALTLNPKDGDVLFNLANLYSASGKDTLAKDYYLKALAVRPDFAEAHYNLGLLFAKLGDKPQAVSHLEQFLKYSPNARNADTIRAYIEKLKA